MEESQGGKPAAVLLGFSAYLFWPFAMFYTPAVSRGTEAAYFDVTVLFALTLTFYVLTLGLVALRPRLALSGRPGSVWAAGAMVSACTVLLFGRLGLSGAPAAAVALVASALGGVGTSYLTLRYGLLCLRLSEEEIRVTLPVCFAITGAAMLFAPLLPQPVLVALLALVPWVPLPSLVRYGLGAGSARAPKGEGAGAPAAGPFACLLGCIALFGLVFGFQRGVFSQGIGASAQWGAACFFGAVAVEALVMAVLAATGRPALRSVRLYGLTAVLMACGLLVLPWSDGVVSSALIGVSFFLFNISTWVVLSLWARRGGERAPRLLALGFASSHVGLLVGSALGLAVQAYGTSGDLTSFVSSALIVVVLFAAVALFPSDALAPASAPAKGSAPAAGTSGDMAEAFGLTAREAEVLALLLAGRNMPYIQEELHISKSTLKTHKRHIFEKTGARNVQELIDLAEGRPLGDPRP